MHRTRFGRPIFGPFRRKAHTGVPADHFAKWEPYALNVDGRTVALVADGPDEPSYTVSQLREMLGLTDDFAASGKAGLPLAERDRAWDGDAAEGRVREWAGGGDSIEDTDWGKYAQAFFYKDTSDGAGENVGDYKLGFADIIDGTLTAVPKGVFAVAGVLQGSRGGADIPDADAETIKGKVAAYYSAMAKKFDDESIKPPWEDDSAAVTLTTPLAKLGEHARRRIDGANEITDPAELDALVASAFAARGGMDALVASRLKRGLTAATDAAGNVTPGDWHAYLCVEGIRTDDGRELLNGSCRFPDLPVSLRLLVEDEGGHWGAVTCGRIDTMDRREVEGTPVIYGDGPFGSDPNGQLAELMVEEQTQRFVSIDPRDVTAVMMEVAVRRTQMGEIVIIDDDDCYDDGVIYDCWWQFSDLVIGAATIVAMPALQQAVITPKSVELPWSPIAMASAPKSVVAAGGPVAPPSAWFENPWFHVGDSRLVRQPDGKYACPLTVTPEGRVYGHAFYWGAKHTAFPGRTVTPPKSRSGYAHFLTGSLTCDDGTEIAVGQITMGTGHAPLTKTMPNGRVVPLQAHEVTAHYDGGYGAIQACDITIGEDDFGGWVAGALRPNMTDEQVREFKALGTSGDWREMAGSLDLLAILSVPAPGFPISRKALTAAGVEVDVTISSDMHAGVTDDDRLFALVAAGVVRRPDPARQIAALERRVDEMEGLVRTLAVERAQALIRP